MCVGRQNSKVAVETFKFQYGACDLPLGVSTKNIRTQFFDARQFLWKSVDTVQMAHRVQMLHMVDVLQELHMAEMLQMVYMDILHIVEMLQMLHKVDTSWW